MSVRLKEARGDSPPVIDISSREVHVWHVDLTASEDASGQSLAQLSIAERQRAERFRFDRDRFRFIGRRLFLRNVLARYTGRHPADIELSTTTHGKPYLSGGAPDRGITFNLSHSGEIAVVAVTRDRAVGIDVETPNLAADFMAIARQFFSAKEAQQLATLPEERRSNEFLRLWTARESLLKATGEGLTIPLDSWEFSAESDALWQAEHPTSEGCRPIEWSILHLDYLGVAVAVAAAGADWNCVLMDDSQACG